MALENTSSKKGYEAVERDFVEYNDYTVTKQRLLKDRPDPTGPNVISPRLVSGRSKGTPLPKPPLNIPKQKKHAFDPAKDARKIFSDKDILPIRTARGEQRRKNWADY